MRINIDKHKFSQFTQDIRRTLPHLTGNVQCVTNGNVTIVSAIRGYKLTDADIAGVTQIAEGYKAVVQPAPQYMPTYEPTRRTNRYSGMRKAASKFGGLR